MLVGCWWQGTYTFHFSVGEATFTLQGVAVLTYLQIDGVAIIGLVMPDVRATFHELLGLTPYDHAFDGTSLLLWRLARILDANIHPMPRRA